MNREDLKQLMPHREPMLLLDEAEKLEDGTGRAAYQVRGDEFFLQGHFPGNPVVPGVIQCEMMAQACAVLLGADLKGTPYYTGIREAKFRKVCRPGDTLIIETQITKTRHPFYFAKAKVKVNGAVHSEAELSFALVEDQ